LVLLEKIYWRNHKWKVFIKKYIVVVLYVVGHSLSSIIIDGFNYKRKTHTKQKKFLAFVLLVNSSIIMVYYWQNKLLKISSMIIRMLPIELSLQRITSNLNFF